MVQEPLAIVFIHKTSSIVRVFKVLNRRRNQLIIDHDFAGTVDAKLL